jgi:mono/diheme cytochrome c family protein
MMSRVLSSLGFVFLTLALVGLSAGERAATGSDLPLPTSSPAATIVPGHPGIPIIRTAQRSPRKKTRKPAPIPETEPAESAPENQAPASGKPAGLKFSRDIAPVFVANCIRCHNERAMAKNGKLDLTTFNAIQKGGKDGAIIVAGKPDESHLYLRLTGDETPRMPRAAGDRPLAEAAIERVGQWIKEGGRLDAGLDPKAPIASYASTPEQLRAAEMAKLSVAERDKLVENAGRQRWKKANPKVDPEVTPDKNFMLFGVLPKARVSSTLKAVEAQYRRMRSLVAAPSGDPAEKIGLYVFNDRTSFVEFVRSLQKREVDSGENGTSDLSIGEPYVAVVDPLGGREEPASVARRPSRARKRDEESGGPERSLAGLITEHLGSGVARHVGQQTPLWLSLGLGSYFAAQADPRSIHTQRQRRAALEEFRLGWNGRALDAFGGEGKAENIRAVGFGIIEAMATVPQTRPYFPVFVRKLLAQSNKLDDILEDVYRMNREQFLAGTGNFVITHYGRTR